MGMERPIYGYLQTMNSAYQGYPYGPVKIVIEPESVKGRVSFTLSNSSMCIGDRRDTGALGKNCWALFEKLKEYNSASSLLAYSRGKKAITSLALFPNYGDYIELQFHGGIDFRRDVKKIIMQGKESEWGHVKKLADKYGIPIEFE